MINNNDDGKVSTVEYNNDLTASSLELYEHRSNANAKPAVNRLFSVDQRVFQERLQ